MTDFFANCPPIAFEGAGTDNEFAFRHYDPDELVLGKSLKDHLRFAVAYWHSFAWDGRDMFGNGTLVRPWLDPAMDPMDAARRAPIGPG